MIPRDYANDPGWQRTAKPKVGDCVLLSDARALWVTHADDHAIGVATTLRNTKTVTATMLVRELAWDHEADAWRMQ